MWVYLTNRDCLSPVQQMVSRLQHCDEVDEIVIVDCGSTYPDLLDWYAMAPAKIIRCENLGPQGAWQVMQDSEEFYAVSDADLDLTNVPNDFLTKLRNGLIDHPRYIKAGLSLAIDDLPLNSPFREEVIRHESQFWTERLDADWYAAAIDTTFAVYRERAWQWYSPSLRAVPPYTARHLPWYLCEGQCLRNGRGILGIASAKHIGHHGSVACFLKRLKLHKLNRTNPQIWRQIIIHWLNCQLCRRSFRTNP